MVLSGSATVTGVGAGTNRRFSVRPTVGDLELDLCSVVSGLTFVETLLEGSITFPGAE